MASNSLESSQKAIPEFSIGEIVKARDRLWRIDQIHKVEKEIHNVKKNFIYYSVSNITDQPSSEVLIPDIEEIRKSAVPRPTPDKVGSPRYQRLLLNAIKLDLIYGTTSFISLQNSKVIPISYQMVPVLMALNLKKVRLLLADDVGLGKTIEAGLILQELLGRKKITRVLFVTPANLREQWRGILKSFFGIDAVIMSSRNRRRLESELLLDGNPWGYYNFVITSTDYAKKPMVKYEILQFDWDMIIIDEAHNVMLPHLGITDTSSDKVKQSYSFAKALADSDKFPHLLLLTATPHNGYKDSFASLLQMINPKIISNNNLKNPEIDRELSTKHICQRRRSDVEKWISGSKYEKNPFPIREPGIEKFIEPSQQFFDTLKLLSKFSNHVLKSFESKPEKQKKFNYWVIFHFHKRMISSPHALLCSINHRTKEIDKRLQRKNLELEESQSLLSLQEAAQSVLDGNETDTLSEEDRDEKSDRAGLTEDLKDLQLEKQILNAIKDTIPELKKKDNKIYRLIDDILPTMFRKSGKVIIFTRYIDTLTYIVENLNLQIENKSLRYKGFKIFNIHGKLASQKRLEAYNNFLKEDKAILVTTDCMAEGIDLQFSANQLINYELTWNPNRLEQRNGRIDRFGQPKKKVYIRTFIMDNTIEMDILNLLVNKANRIKEDYGFVPGFFGDPKAIIDHIYIRQQKKAQVDGTLDKWVGISNIVLESLVSIFFSETNYEEVLKDSFYGQNNINLDEIERRMYLTKESIGDNKTLYEFLEGAIRLFSGQINPLEDSEEVFQVILPEKIQKEIGVNFKDRYKITTNMEISAKNSDIEGINLKNSLVSGLIDKVKNEAFSERHDFYGRTAAVSSSEITDVTVIFNVKIRYVVNTEPKSLMEEIAQMGIELFIPEVILTDADLDKLWRSRWENHGKSNKYIQKHLKRALELDILDKLLVELGEKRLKTIVKERRKMIKNLKEQGVAADMEGIDDIEVVGVDMLTLTIIYPLSEGE